MNLAHIRSDVDEVRIVRCAIYNNVKKILLNKDAKLQSLGKQSWLVIHARLTLVKNIPINVNMQHAPQGVLFTDFSTKQQ